MWQYAPMAEPSPIAVIVNPAAHKGGAARHWPSLETELSRRLGPVRPRFTEAPGHATALARESLAEGARRLIVAGGDGTVNEAMNGMLDPAGQLVHADSVLCPIPAGTANELCRALGHLAQPSLAFEAAAGRGARAIDIMRLRCVGLDGHPVERYGYLIMALGGAATISHRTSRSRWLKKLGEIAYLLMTPAVTLTYRQRAVSITIDGAPQGTRRLFTAMVGNTENGGGGMKLVPGARFDDGVLDLIEMGDVSRFTLLFGVLPKLYSGAHAKHLAVRMSRGKSFRFDSDAETLVDLDGETVGRLPLEIEIVPQAVRIGVP